MIGTRIDYGPERPATARLDLVFEDGTFEVTLPMQRWLAEGACLDFGAGVPWINGKRVVQATIIPPRGAPRHPTSGTRWH